jgi:Arc/MetJ family transcription regulator
MSKLYDLAGLEGWRVMAKALLGLDEHLLAGAAAALGTATKKDTVTRALRKVGEDARPARRRAQRSARGGGRRRVRLRPAGRPRPVRHLAGASDNEWPAQPVTGG